ncbi:MAG TPA: hypothetical protein VM327_01455 [Candidatus Thermoplasmatota archaeon]|nr:hypothetical protein [Candidatus Thermoplasmatota archaeon]
MVDLGPFFPPGTPTLTWELDNPLAYFNLAGFVLCILILVRLRDRRGESSLVDGAWASTWVLCIGTGLHLVGDVIGVSEAWDHQFIHLVVLVALVVFWLAVRRGD